jgi:putative transcriptional regulator
MDLLVDSGSLLAAAPDMLDPNFMHSVVLIVQHTHEGAYGLVINRPSSITVNLLFSEHPVLSKLRFGVHSGGPVGLDTLQFLHCVPEAIPGGAELVPGLYLGGELEALAALLASDPVQAARCVRLLLGYSGWDAGQLESELTHGAWVPAPLSEVSWMFQDDPQALWRKVIRSLGRHAQGLEDLPPDPSWN